ncbi:hypothetical protein HGRIS_003743 [Hohenbuehelia grisea]|uniref:Methyltransferase domain-containing protein n=1 Tax=Hohenbuehelia grisea TaxID=104357 RepID=A0ABR3JGF9_9AGAR
MISCPTVRPTDFQLSPTIPLVPFNFMLNDSGVVETGRPIYNDAKHKAPLDENLYRPDERVLGFLKAQIGFGIDDDEALKQHIFTVQRKAYDIYGYPCIRQFGFIDPQISELPVYPRVLQLGREREDGILVDIGCGFGTDIRKAVADGFPSKGAIACDLRKEFWDYGHELFKTTEETCPIKFIHENVFDVAAPDPHSPLYTTPSTHILPESLRSLASLSTLRGHISAIHASCFFHLFGENEQLQLAKILASLLSPLPGSVIFGTHAGLPEQGLRMIPRTDVGVFCHSPQSWRQLWDGTVFAKGSVQADAELVEIHGTDSRVTDARNDFKLFRLVWSITRVESSQSYE